jgi:hypothetical protein
MLLTIKSPNPWKYSERSTRDGKGDIEVGKGYRRWEGGYIP